MSPDNDTATVSASGPADDVDDSEDAIPAYQPSTDEDTGTDDDDDGIEVLGTDDDYYVDNGNDVQTMPRAGEFYCQ